MAGYIGSKSSVTQVDGYTRDETDALVPTSIDDNGNATAITIDSSERVLIGKSSTAFSTAGHRIDADGNVEHIRDSNPPLNLNRKGTDGGIAVFYKDGTAVGAIQARSSFTTLQIGSTGTGITGTSSHKILPSVNNARSDNTNDLGDSSYRWKDAYLSGGVYLGGTGSANKLEDYETGTFTPSIGFNANTSGITFQATPAGLYTKVGRKVTVIISFVLTNKGSNSGNFTCSLPFGSHSSGQGSGVMGYNYSWADGDKARGFTFQVHSGVLYMMNADSGGFATNGEFTNTTYISGITVTYFTP